VLVDRARHELLARAALAGDEHRRLRRRDAPDDIVDALHRGAVAEQATRTLAARHDRTKAVHLAREAMVLHGPADGEREELGIDGLHDEVERTRAQRADRGIDARVARHHDDGEIGARLGDALTELEPVERAHLEVRHDDVEIVLHRIRERLVRVRLGDRAKATRTERVRDELGRIDVVVDHEHGPGRGGGQRSGGHVAPPVHRSNRPGTVTPVPRGLEMPGESGPMAKRRVPRRHTCCLNCSNLPQTPAHGGAPAGRAGRSRKKSAPRPGSLSTPTAPPCASAMPRTM
jgi:hypothetical protein